MLYVGFNCVREKGIYKNWYLFFYFENKLLIFWRLLVEIYVRVVGIFVKRESWRNVGFDIFDWVGNYRYVCFGVKVWVNYYKYVLLILIFLMIIFNR